MIREIKDLIERYQLRTLWFYDDTFNMNKARVERICDLILEKKLDIISPVPSGWIWPTRPFSRR